MKALHIRLEILVLPLLFMKIVCISEIGRLDFLMSLKMERFIASIRRQESLFGGDNLPRLLTILRPVSRLEQPLPLLVMADILSLELKELSLKFFSILIPVPI